MENVLKTNDFTYHNLKSIISNKSLVVLKGDEDSNVVIMDKPDYAKKCLRMIKEGV